MRCLIVDHDPESRLQLLAQLNAYKGITTYKAWTDWRPRVIAPSRVRVAGHFCVTCDRLIRLVFGSFITYAFKWWRESRRFSCEINYMSVTEIRYCRVDAGFDLTRLCRLHGSGDGNGSGRADW